MVEYQEIFLNEIKLLLPYLFKFSEDSIIVSKEYPSDCVVKRPKKRPVIIIIRNKSTFSPNDRWKKI